MPQVSFFNDHEAYPLRWSYGGRKWNLYQVPLKYWRPDLIICETLLGPEVEPVEPVRQIPYFLYSVYFRGSYGADPTFLPYFFI